MTGILATPLQAAFRKTCAACFNVVFPDGCRICERPLRNLSRVPVCPACLDQLEPFSPEFFCVCCRTPFLNPRPLDAQGRCPLCRLGLLGYDAAYCYGAYEGTLRKLIHLLKYQGIRSLAGPLGDQLAGAFPRDQRFDLIVPVPLYWRRLWERGFNQAELLAGRVARRCGIPLQRVLRRRRATTTQAGLSNSARRANVAGAFTLRRRASVRQRRILLVDDVLTTGATASACAAALRRAGAAYTAVLTLARVDRRAGVEPWLVSHAAGAGT